MEKSRKTLNQILSLMTVAFNELSSGISIGWLAPILVILQDPKGEFRATLDESSWLAGIQYMGAIPGTIFTALTLDIIGRKVLLTSAAMAFFLMWVVNALAKSILVLCAVRAMFGFFAGLNDSANSTYLAENSSPKIRSIFGAFSIILYHIGLLTEYAIAPYFSYTVTCIVNAVITFLALLSVFWIKEPVQFLLMKGKVKQAEENFAWLHGGNIDNDEIKYEFERIKQNAQSENSKKSSFKAIITSRANYKSLLIIMTFNALVACTGYSTVMSYTAMNFVDSDILTSYEFTVLFGIVQFLFVISTSFFVDRFSRRRLILSTFALIALFHAVTATLYYVNSNIFEIPYFPWLIFSSITLYAGIYAALYPVVFIIRGELFPLSVKAVGGCLSVISWSVMNFLMTKISPNVSKNYGTEANFCIFFVFSLITMVFVYFFLPETKNKTLIEIQEILEQTKWNSHL